MNRKLAVPVVLAVLLCITWEGLVEAQRADGRRRPQTVPRALGEKPPPWTGFSARALVTHPATIAGVETWTIESRRHRGSIVCMSLSPDGKQLVTGGIDGTIRLWDVESGKFLRALLGHDSYVYSLSWSPNSSTVASAGSHDGTVRLWDVESGRQTQVIKGLKGYVYHVAWSPNGNSLIAAGGTSGWVWLSTGSGEGSIAMEVGQHVYHLAWSPDSNQLAACGRQLPVSVVDISTKKSSRSFGAVDDAFMATAWSPDGRFLAGAGSTGTTVWDLKSEEEKVVVRLAGASGSVAWSPDGKQLVTAASSGGQVQIWDFASGKPIGPVPGSATRVVWHPKSQQIVTMSSVHYAVFDPAAGKQLRSVDAGGSAPPVWTAGRPVVGGLGTTTLSLWDAATAKYLRSLEGHTAAVADVAWSRDGRTLASASHDKTVRLWETRSGEALETLQGHTGAVTVVAWAPDGKTLASAGTDKTVMLWNAKGENLAKLEGHDGPVTSLVWARGGSLLASGSSDRSIILWDTDKKRQARSIPTIQPVHSVAWATVGRTSVLACGTTDETVRIINAATSAELGNLISAASPPNVASVCWLPDPAFLLAGRSCHRVQLWDVKASKAIHSLPAMAPVQYVTWGDNGDLLVSGNSERTVRFWDRNTGVQRGVLLEEKDGMVMIAADGTWRWDSNKKPDVVFVALTAADTQLSLTADEFASRFRTGKGKSRSRSASRN